MKKISEKVLYKGQWLCVKHETFINERRQKIIWESTARNRGRMAFSVIAKMVPSGRYILIKQFRQAINNYVIGFPAGICEAESPSQTDLNKSIIKELKEETGYTGAIKSRSPLLKLNPAIMDHDFMVVTAQVDEKDPRNKKVQQCLEPEEEIKVVLVKAGKLKQFLLAESKKGVAISSGMWFLASSLD